MRINSIGIRTNYSLSWENKILFGRNYNKHLIKTQSYLNQKLKNFFFYPVVNNFLLLSKLNYKFYSNNILLINVYLYVYKYTDIFLHRFSRKTLKNKSKKFHSFTFKVFLENLCRKIYYVLNFYFSNLFKFNFIIVYNRFFTAELISQYVVKQLSNKFKLNRIMSSLGRDIILNKKNKGLLIHCSGRFDRKERASYHIFAYGKVSMSTFNNKIYYVQNKITMKYGVCGIKVWLLKK